jgi:ABC-type dipeptide/oligopeptide/nickel transport system ATPase component
VGAGDAENDHSFLSLCGCSAAVANALPVLKEEVDIVLSGDHGIGVAELVGRILNEDAGLLARTERGISAGTDVGGDRHYLLPEDLVLIVGNSGCGKSSYATLLTEEMSGRRHEFCIIDPEGDYIDLDDAETIGGLTEPPTTQEALRLLLKARVNVVVNAQALSLNDRQRLFSDLIESIRDLRKKSGRPQWLVIDESHHMMPSSDSNNRSFPKLETGAILLTLTPRALPRPILKEVTAIIAMGGTASSLLEEFAHMVRLPLPAAGPQTAPDDKLLWRPKGSREAARLRSEAPRQVHNRHAGKYATGDVGEWHSFYFRGPDDSVNLRARNLAEFVSISRTLNDGIWNYHLQRGDYAEWFRHVIKDDVLTEEAQAARADTTLGIGEARSRLIDAIGRRYKI